jgi:hypothetical protein
MGVESMETAESTPARGSLSRRTILVGAAGLAGSVATGLLAATPASAAQQTGWRWCNRCQCLFYGDNYTSGWCVRGGGHNWRGSGNYKPHHDYHYGEDDWHWCDRCQSMWRGGDDHHNSACPSGAGHRRYGSGNYSFEYGNDYEDREQPGWRRCRRCYCMCYSGQGNGYCPRGGGHNFNGSRKYFVPYV